MILKTAKHIKTIHMYSYIYQDTIPEHPTDPTNIWLFQQAQLQGS